MSDFVKISLAVLAALAVIGTSHAADELIWVRGFEFSEIGSPVTEVNNLSSVAQSVESTKQDGASVVTVKNPGVWRGYYDAGLEGVNIPHFKTYGHETIRLDYSISTAAPLWDGTSFSIQFYGGEHLQIASARDLIADGARHTLEFKLPSSANDKQLCALWTIISNPGPGALTMRLHKFEVYRPRMNTRIDADKILSTPPPYNAKIADCNGMPAMYLNGKPITGQGWSVIVMVHVTEEYLKTLTNSTGYRLHRVVATLGEHLYGGDIGAYYSPNWLGPDHFDFWELDKQLGQFKKANPDSKMILLLASDGARWWSRLHPKALGMDAKLGIPDYLSPEWQKDFRDALRQMIAHIQSGQYADMVIGYELFNGRSMDCNFEVNDSTPAAIGRYRQFLRDKYKTNRTLQKAWKDTSASFETAKPEALLNEQHPRDPNDEMSLLVSPVDRPAYMDSKAFREHVFQQIIINFGKVVKEATHNRALVGARTGDFTGNLWSWTRGLEENDTNPIAELVDSRYFDFFDVQEPYVGRNAIGVEGSGAPIIPPLGLAITNKLVVIQNDVRTHTGPDMGFGATKNMAETISTQRRVFVNSMVLGMYPYLWQMSYSYDMPGLIAEYRKQDDIFLRSLYADRRSGAEIALVFDKGFQKQFGYDPLKDAPARSFPLFDYIRQTVARAGAPYDMIFLDQLPKAKPYKLYLFLNTVALNAQQRAMVKKVVRRDGRVGMFAWADGLIDGSMDAAHMSDLTGIKIAMSKTPAKWKLTPEEWFVKQMGIKPDHPMGTLEYYDPSDKDAPDITYAPSFKITDTKATPIARFTGSSDVGIASKQAPTWASIYTASGNFSPSLLRYALRRAGGFEYVDTDDICYVNNTFVGLHTKRTGIIHISLPKPSSLYDVFGDKEYAAVPRHAVSVEKMSTYLFYRGTKAQWQALGKKAGVR